MTKAQSLAGAALAAAFLALAGSIAKAIAAKGSLTLWQYAVTQKDDERMVAPRAKIGVLAASSLRIEPYKQPFKVLPHE